MSIRAYSPTNETVLDLSHAPVRGLVAETEEGQWNFRSGQWQKLEGEEIVESQRSKVFQHADLLRSFGIRPDPKSTEFAPDQIWSVSSSGLWHVYRENAMSRKWPLSVSFPTIVWHFLLKQGWSLTERLHRTAPGG